VLTHAELTQISPATTETRRLIIVISICLGGDIGAKACGHNSG
jgi:hypothetical protein